MSTNQEIIDDLVAFYGDAEILPTRAQWQAVVENTHQGSVVIINLITMREKAAYPDGSDSELSGMEAMARYSEISHKKVAEVGGEFVIQGMFGGTIIGQNEAWEGVGIVRYPSTKAFIALFSDEEYRQGHVHRMAATLKHQMSLVLEV